MGTTYVPNPIQSGFRDTDAFDTQLTEIADELDNMLSRVGTGPNAMEADLDIGSNRMLNVGPGINGPDGVNLAQVQSITAAAVEAGGGSQGQTTGDPITFNFGIAVGSQGTMTRTVFDLNALFGVTAFLGLTVILNGVVQIPTLAYNTSDEVVTFTESVNADTDMMFIFGDLSPVPVFSSISATLVETTATATAAQVLFTAPTYVIGQEKLMVHIDGIMQSLGFADYTETTTTSITLDEAMAGGERIVIREISGVTS